MNQLFTYTLSRYILILSFRLNFGLPLLFSTTLSFFLRPSPFFHALLVNISSMILCMCPAHHNLLPTTFILVFLHSNVFSRVPRLHSIVSFHFTYSPTSSVLTHCSPKYITLSTCLVVFLPTTTCRSTYYSPIHIT